MIYEKNRYWVVSDTFVSLAGTGQLGMLAKKPDLKAKWGLKIILFLSLASFFINFIKKLFPKGLYAAWGEEIKNI